MNRSIVTTNEAARRPMLPGIVTVSDQGLFEDKKRSQILKITPRNSMLDSLIGKNEEKEEEKEISFPEIFPGLLPHFCALSFASSLETTYWKSELDKHNTSSLMGERYVRCSGPFSPYQLL